MFIEMFFILSRGSLCANISLSHADLVFLGLQMLESVQCIPTAKIKNIELNKTLVHWDILYVAKF